MESFNVSVVWQKRALLTFIVLSGLTHQVVMIVHFTQKCNIFKIFKVSLLYRILLPFVPLCCHYYYHYYYYQ